MDINEFPRGQLNPTILSCLVSGDKYGYEIIEEIKAKTGIEIKQPSLYSSLKRMEVQKLVSSYWKDSAIGGKRHYYCLTNDGRKFLEENPVDFSLYGISNQPASPIEEQKESNTLEETKLDVEKNEEFKTEPETFEKSFDLKATEEYRAPNESGIVLNSAKPVSIVPEETNEIEVENEPIQIAAQENIFNLAKQEEEKVEQEKAPALEDKAQEEKDVSQEQYDLFSEVDMAADDGKFITETLEDYSFPKFEKFEPATLNIEQRNTSYLNSKLKEKETKADRKEKEMYQEKISDLMVKPFDHEKSMAKIQHKIDEFEAQKRKQKELEMSSRPSAPAQKQQPKPKREEFDKVENTYVREKSDSKIFNSYSSLETYYGSKGIGFSQYRGKDKNASQYVNPALTRLIRGSLFCLLSLIFAFAFYFGVKADSIGKVIYIIIPCLSLVAVGLYAYLYYKSKARNIIQMKKENPSPWLFVLAGAAIMLVIIGINLIIGFRANTTLKYFPLLIYPIVLSLHIVVFPFINMLIEQVVRKVKRLVKYK